MTEPPNGIIERAKVAVEAIAQQMIEDARNSGTEPIVFVTGNACMPPLRSYDEAEAIWQEDDPTNYGWEMVYEHLESLLAAANVYMDAPDYDNCLYVIDLNRFQYREHPEGENLSDDWVPIP